MRLNGSIAPYCGYGAFTGYKHVGDVVAFVVVATAGPVVATAVDVACGMSAAQPDMAIIFASYAALSSSGGLIISGVSVRPVLYRRGGKNTYASAYAAPANTQNATSTTNAHAGMRLILFVCAVFRATCGLYLTHCGVCHMTCFGKSPRRCASSRANADDPGSRGYGSGFSTT